MDDDERRQLRAQFDSLRELIDHRSDGLHEHLRQLVELIEESEWHLSTALTKARDSLVEMIEPRHD